MSLKLSPFSEGIDHINVYSKSKTDLGRLLTNFAHTPFTHPKYGHFESIEGAWFYFLTGKRHEKLRKLHGSAAKMQGSNLVPREWRSEMVYTEDFKQIINECTQCKFRQHTDILLKLISNDLPLEHYYIVGDKVINKNKYQWVLDEIIRIRKVTQVWYVKKYGQLPNISLTIID